MEYRLIEKKQGNGEIYYTAEYKDISWFSSWYPLTLGELGQEQGNRGLPIVLHPKTEEEAHRIAKKKTRKLENEKYRRVI